MPTETQELNSKKLLAIHLIIIIFGLLSIYYFDTQQQNNVYMINGTLEFYRPAGPDNDLIQQVKLNCRIGPDNNVWCQENILQER